MRRMVIATGNPYRRDDGVGPAVLGRLAEVRLPDVELVEESGDPAALITRWAGAGLVVLVDAVSSQAAPGTIHRLECRAGRWEVPGGWRDTSTHGTGIAEAVELGGVLGTVPQRLVLLGIETADVRNGVGLTPVVAAAVPRVVDLVAGLLAESQPGRRTGPDSHPGAGRSGIPVPVGPATTGINGDDTAREGGPDVC